MIQKIYVHSTWTPPHWTIPPIALEERLTRFSSALSKLFKTRQGKTNLLPHQHRALQTLQQQQTFLIVSCHKNLGPAIIERHNYLKIAMRNHLSDTTTYKSLTTSEIDRYSLDITKNILGWMKTHHKKLTKDAVRAGLHLVMTMNIFTFGDLTLKQLNWTAMGTPPSAALRHNILQNS